MTPDDDFSLTDALTTMSDDAEVRTFMGAEFEDAPLPPNGPIRSAPMTDDLPPMPCPTELLDSTKSIEQQITTLVEADALLAATSNVRLGQKLAELAEMSDDIEEVRKAYQTFGARADLIEKRKLPATSQVPLTIVFERAPLEGVKIDVRSGAVQAKLRAAASDATDAVVKVAAP